MNLKFLLAFSFLCVSIDSCFAEKKFLTPEIIQEDLKFKSVFKGEFFKIDVSKFGDFNSNDYPEKYIVQKLDHFDRNSKKKWKQRYWISSDFFNGTGPVFLICGQLNAENPFWLNPYTISTSKLAKKHRALLILLETRFYGKSRPTDDLSNENLVYLSFEQILADIAHFRKFIYKKLKLSESQKLITFGGSMSAVIAAYARLKYPKLIYGAVASSAPMKLKINFKNYMENVGNVIKKISPECFTELKHASSKMDEFMETKNYNQIASVLNSCQPIQSEEDALTILYNIPFAFGYFVQYYVDYNAVNKMKGVDSLFFNKKKYNFSRNKNNITLGRVWDVKLQKSQFSYIETVCSIMTNKTNGDVLQRFKALNEILYGTNCIDASYKNKMSKLYGDRSWNSSTASTLAYVYQQCSQFQMFATSDSPNQPFGNFLPLDFHMKQCVDNFGQFDLEYQKKNLEENLKKFGGLNFKGGSRVIFLNGGFDPWHSNGFYKKPPNKKTDSLFFQGLSHCSDIFTYELTPNEPTQLTHARKEYEKIVASWIKQN